MSDTITCVDIFKCGKIDEYSKDKIIFYKYMKPYPCTIWCYKKHKTCSTILRLEKKYFERKEKLIKLNQ